MLVVNKILTVSPEQLRMVIHGMRNPMESWDKSDTVAGYSIDGVSYFRLGYADKDLMQRLYKGGSEHRKYARMMPIWIDITAPLYWWKEFDTYKVGAVRNSCSTMHRIHVHKIKRSMFSCDAIEELGGEVLECFDGYLEMLNYLRKKFNETKNKTYWRALIQMLPDSFNMRSDVMITFETAFNIEHQRKGHKLSEWATLIEAFHAIPYYYDILDGEES